MIFPSSELLKCNPILSSSLSIETLSEAIALILVYPTLLSQKHDFIFCSSGKQLVRKRKFKRFSFSVGAILTTADCSVVPIPVTATFSHKQQD